MSAAASDSWQRTRRSALCALAVLAVSAGPAAAQLAEFTNRNDFVAALPGTPATITFEAFAPGTLLPSGAALGDGVSVSYTIDDGAGGFLTLAVVDVFDTTSGTRSLGVDDPFNEDQLLLGDPFDFAIAGGTRAFGFTLITGDPLFAGDVRLVTSQGEVVNGATTETELADGGLVYFVGFVAVAPVSEVDVRYDPDAVGAAFFNVDDVTLVPAAGPGASAAAAAAALAALRLRSRIRKETP